MKKRTAIIGATPNPNRYAYMAAEMLVGHGYEIVPIGIKKGEVGGQEILDIREQPEVGQIHTITLYIGPRHQPEWYDYLISLKPKRIIFNPGTENHEFQRKARKNRIEIVEACTLVMLRVGTY